jgi:hypothetical protein
MRVDRAHKTRLLRELDFELVIAPNAKGGASGRLYLDDGESVSPSSWSEITFEYDSSTRSAAVSGIRLVLGLCELYCSSSCIGTAAIGKVVQVDKPLTSEMRISIA